MVYYITFLKYLFSIILPVLLDSMSLPRALSGSVPSKRPLKRGFGFKEAQFTIFQSHP
jgi:hypothetical protein